MDEVSPKAKGQSITETKYDMKIIFALNVLFLFFRGKKKGAAGFGILCKVVHKRGLRDFVKIDSSLFFLTLLCMYLK